MKPLAMVRNRGEAILGSIPSNGQVQANRLGKNGVIVPQRFKRTNAFAKQCQFLMDIDDGQLERCESDSEHGIYYGNDTIIKMVSLCKFHTIYMESLWIGKREE